MSAKTDILPIVTGHFATLRDAGSGKYRPGDFVVQIGIPGVLAVVGGAIGKIDLSDQYSNILATLAIVFGFAFAATVFIFQLRMQMAEMQVSSKSEPVADIAPQIDTRAPGLVNELFSNCLYATVLSGFAAFATGFVGVANLGRIADCLLVGLFGHLMLVLMMCFKRLNAAYGRVSSLAA